VEAFLPFQRDLFSKILALGRYRTTYRAKARLERVVSRKSFQELVNEGKRLTKEELKLIHAQCYIQLSNLIKQWKSEKDLGSCNTKNNRNSRTDNDNNHMLRTAYDYQDFMILLCHFKLGTQRNEAISWFDIRNVRFNNVERRFEVKFDFLEKRPRHDASTVGFPRDMNPFWEFFLQTVRPFIVAYAAEKKDIVQLWISRGTKKNQSLLSLPSLSAVPLSGNMVSCAVKQEVHKLVSKKNISTLEWRHTLVSLFVIEKHMAKYRKLYDFGDALAKLQNHDKSTLLKYYLDINYDEVTALIEQINEDLIETKESRLASKQASESINPYPKEDDDENCINEDVVEEIAVTLPWEIFWYSYHFLIF
jgi:hypothetical protein